MTEETTPKDLIYEPRDNDVLLGRGSNTNRHIGNERFRLLVAARKLEYNASRKHPRKKVLAQEVFDAVHASGGRFLKQVEYNVPESDGDEEEGAWYPVEVTEALEKCKQALREKFKPRKRGIGTNRGDGGTFTHRGPVCSLPGGRTAIMAGFPPAGFGHYGVSSTPVLPSPMLARAHLPGVYSHLALFQNTPHSIRQNRHPLGRVVLPETRRRELLQAIQQQSTLLADNLLYSRIQGMLANNTFPLGGMTRPIPNGLQRTSAREPNISSTTLRTGNSSTSNDETTEPVPLSEEGTRATVLPDEEVSDLLLSFLERPDLPRLTEEQLAAEQASLTEDERVDALVDKFGKYCTIEPCKRIKRDLDLASIQVLIKQMRLEIERIPEIKKRALLEAQSKCNAEEFSDSRLEQFLRCEDMDPERGAQRFVNYWECRKEVFGSERYLGRMTLSEALRDEDIVALETGLVCPLPVLDCSGRQMLLTEHCRHTREGYSLENMLRAYWYVIEVLAQENHHVKSGIVLVAWSKDSTVWDYDLRLSERTTTFERTCWPVRFIVCHCCCPSWCTVKILKPIMAAFLDKRFRVRLLIHDVPESQVPEALSDYGILKEMLPTHMGGNLEFGVMEWIANRRAVELEAI